MLPLLPYFKALAHETRLRLVHVLHHYELNVGELVRIFGTGQSRVASAVSIALVEGAYRDSFNTDDAYYRVESAADEYVDLHLGVKLLAGAGDWIDADPWPLVAARATSVSSNTSFRITCASATTAPG